MMITSIGFKRAIETNHDQTLESSLVIHLIDDTHLNDLSQTSLMFLNQVAIEIAT